MSRDPCWRCYALVLATRLGSFNNPVDKAGRHRVRIHAIGFPAGAGSPPFINARFSALMRAMCDENEGTFVGLTVGPESCAIKIDVLGTPRCVS